MGFQIVLWDSEKKIITIIIIIIIDSQKIIIIIINTDCRRGCQLSPIQLTKIPYSENETENKVLIITSFFLHALINDNVDN